MHSEPSNQQKGNTFNRARIQSLSARSIEIVSQGHPYAYQPPTPRRAHVGCVQYTPTVLRATPANNVLIGPSNYPLPPQLAARKPIPLPPLSDSAIMIHPLLAVSQSAPPPIAYDLSFPPIAAFVSQPRFASRSSPEDWRTYPAMMPSTVSSITIRIPRIERPVVVLPVTLEQSMPTIGNVLDMIYSVICWECMTGLEPCGHTADGAYSTNTSTLGNDPIRRPNLSSATPDSLLSNSIRQHFNNKCTWIGLYPSGQEDDVWVLQMR